MNKISFEIAEGAKYALQFTSFQGDFQADMSRYRRYREITILNYTTTTSPGEAGFEKSISMSSSASSVRSAIGDALSPLPCP